jgi:exodeoxyribonuclease VII small subunit
MTENIATLSFEECYERLEQVISTLEAGELALDQSIALYEEGMRLAASCGQRLDDAQIKVTQLLATAESKGGGADAEGLSDEDIDDDSDKPNP